LDDLALLDFEDGTGGCVNGTPDVNDRVAGTVPEGHYTGLRFTLGVPFSAGMLAIWRYFETEYPQKSPHCGPPALPEK